MISIQLGDVASRIRRFTRAVGNLAVNLEQNAYPYVLLQDLSQPPFASEPKYASLHQSVGALAANLSGIGVQAAPNTVFVVDAIWIDGQTAVSNNILSVVREQANPSPTLSIGRANLFAVNIPAPSIGTPVLSLAAATMAGVQQATVFGTIVANYINCPAGIFLTVAQALAQPIVLFGSQPQAQPGASAGPTGDCCVVTAGQANTAIGATFYGREYSLLQGARNQ